MEFLGLESMSFYGASVFPFQGLITYFFILPCRLVPSSMDDGPQSMESGPQSWILDHGMGDRVQCMQLSKDKPGVHGSHSSIRVQQFPNILIVTPQNFALTRIDICALTSLDSRLDSLLCLRLYFWKSLL